MPEPGTWPIVEDDESLSGVRARCVDGSPSADTSLVSLDLEHGDFASFWPVFTPGGTFAYVVIQRGRPNGGTFVSMTNDQHLCRACDRRVKGLSTDPQTKTILVHH